MKDILLFPFKNYSKIEENLFLGNYNSIIDTNFLKNNNIKYIISIIDIPINNKHTFVNYIHVNVKDDKTIKANKLLYDNLFELINIINKIQPNNGVLIHCMYGFQRSATVIACYLMWKYNLHYTKAIKYVKFKRPFAFETTIHFEHTLIWWNDYLQLIR